MAVLLIVASLIIAGCSESKGPDGKIQIESPKEKASPQAGTPPDISKSSPSAEIPKSDEQKNPVPVAPLTAGINDSDVDVNEGIDEGDDSSLDIPAEDTA